MHPIFVNGDYPEIMKEKVRAKRAELELPTDLIEFTSAEKALILGSADFLGINYWDGFIAHDAEDPKWWRTKYNWFKNTFSLSDRPQNVDEYVNLWLKIFDNYYPEAEFGSFIEYREEQFLADPLAYENKLRGEFYLMYDNFVNADMSYKSYREEMIKKYRADEDTNPLVYSYGCAR